MSTPAETDKTNEVTDIPIEEGEGAIVLFTGGPDSSTLLAWAVENEIQPIPVYFHGGDPESVTEIKVAEDIADIYDLDVLAFDIHGIHSTNPMGVVPFEHRPVIPYASGVILSISISYALQEDIPHILLALHYDDSQESPEYQLQFLETLQESVNIIAQDEEYKPVQIHAPFIRMEKSAVMQLGEELGVPLHKTWSCMADPDIQCGNCQACLARRRAMEEAGIEDQTQYRNLTCYNREDTPHKG